MTVQFIKGWSSPTVIIIKKELKKVNKSAMQIIQKTNIVILILHKYIFLLL